MKHTYIRVNIDSFDVDLIKEMEEFYFPTEKDWNIPNIIEAFKAGFKDYIKSDFVEVDAIDTNLQGIYYYFDLEVLFITIDGRNVYIGEMVPSEPYF